MYNGICLQSATSHYFGQRFSKAYGIKFMNRKNELEYAYQTSWGFTTRSIGGLIMVHSDNYGLVLPPKIAPRQVVIIPITNDEAVMTLIKKYESDLTRRGITNYIDMSEKSPGFKFAEAEVNGIPIRLEIGLRDLGNEEITLVRRDTREKIKISVKENIVEKVVSLLNDIQVNLYDRAKKRRDEMTYTALNMQELEDIISKTPGFVKAMWCQKEECENKIKEINGTKARCLPFDQEHISDKCVCCGETAKSLVIWGRQY